jgi:hypothetical protein
MIPAILTRLFKDAADDAVDGLVHGGMRARSWLKGKPQLWPGLRNLLLIGVKKSYRMPVAPTSHHTD